jgi:hypothetical protein
VAGPIVGAKKTFAIHRHERHDRHAGEKVPYLNHFLVTITVTME